MSDAFHSHLESPAAGTTLPPGRHAFNGWVWPAATSVVVDVRARVGDRLFAGVHGLPRADLAAHFKTGRQWALAGFTVAVELEAGPQHVVLEALEIDGHWRPFHTVSYSVDAAQPRVDFAVPAGPLRWIDYGHGLRHLIHGHGRQRHANLDAAADALARELPWPRVLRDAPAPLLGFVDEPASVCCCRFGRIPAFGHLFHPQLRTRRILATVDLQSWQPLAINQPSPGPAAYYSQYANAQACGFIGLVDVPAQLPNPVTLRIYAELEDGSLHLGPVVRTRVHTTAEEGALAQESGSPTFEIVQAAWDRALAKRQLPIARDADCERYVQEIRAAYDAAGRRPTSAVPALVETPATRASVPRRVLLATHGLSLQGAPRFLLDLGRALAAAGSSVEVVSAEDGPLRAAFAEYAKKITLVPADRILSAGDPATARAAIADVVAAADWAGADLVIANSFTTFWAVHAGKAAERPTLFYVHESTTPATFYGSRVAPTVVALADEAFALADTVSFTTAATRSHHVHQGNADRHRLTSGWIEVAALDRWKEKQDRVARRAELGIGPDELLVCNIGTVSDRKGQHTFARAVDLLWRRHPALAAKTKFILLGGRQTPFYTMLDDVLRDLARPNLVVHPETTDYLRYYLAADLFVCSSYEESSPRVVLEAMALGTPILATAVHGIPELVRPELEAMLLPAGHTLAWCEALARSLGTPAVGATLAARARARVIEHFAADRVLPRHLALAGQTAGARQQ